MKRIQVNGRNSRRIQQNFRGRPQNKKKIWYKRFAVGIISIMIFLLNTTFIARDNLSVLNVNDFKCGSHKAILTLPNGIRIDLSDARSGRLFNLEGTEIMKADDSTLVYKIARLKSNASESNTITTPKGSQYKVILPDGTRVWLNAASSLTFNTSLNYMGLRKVKLVGEAYFEVKKDKTYPFIVSTGQQELEVLGTHFNVSAYPGERSIETTLLEGSVRIFPHLSQGQTKPSLRLNYITLKPNQQSTLRQNDIQVEQVDGEQAVAWKNGDFNFRNESLESIMSEISRWYDVGVIYEDKRLAQKPFGGMISRSQKLADVLSVLEITGDVHFKVEGRKVIVME